MLFKSVVQFHRPTVEFCHCDTGWGGFITENDNYSLIAAWNRSFTKVTYQICCKNYENNVLACEQLDKMATKKTIIYTNYFDNTNKKKDRLELMGKNEKHTHTETFNAYLTIYLHAISQLVLA